MFVSLLSVFSLVNFAVFDCVLFSFYFLFLSRFGSVPDFLDMRYVGLYHVFVL